MTENVQGTFVSEKISKIRWRHEQFSDAKHFVTGSWDDAVNKISYWTFQKNDEDELYPVNISAYPVIGDVTEMKFISYDHFVASSSLGTVKVLKLQDNPYPDIKEESTWDLIHRFNQKEPASCTALSTFEQDIVTVGEDGRINLLTAQQNNPVRTIDEADSCSLHCVDFLRHSEILTGNIRGHMKVWDLRSEQDTPATTIMLSEQSKTEATSIAHHPTQKHIVVAGGGDGSLTVWDLRYNTYPISQLSAHCKSVSEILFHNDQPENLFTCSISGELWHWNNTQHSKLNLDTTDSHWLNNIGNKGKLHVNSLCTPMHKPINSIDINKNTVLFGCDNEAIYIIRNINI
ncbi:PREDICTED: nucleoporin Nup43 [Ceratosolen solmsi marchali]|uniref:Nucleoporin Nup43 n=1 Tax=Ceratosolen solmsi marchali TaxID=326594 RepID=A0AAJ6VLY7_9HYME|nr:PREDICTED: nucleoporin Nup43 [Ceratosolen solmsi marchali]